MAIDLRSDTVTKPTPEMRAAMASADVGDDVFGEDPTVNALQETVAELLGMEAALFTPTGSMADQIALQALTNPGDAVMCAPDAHIAFHEAGASPRLAGVQFSFLPQGRFTAQDVRSAFHPDDHHHPPTTLVEVENTYNMGGGQVWAPENLSEVRKTAHDLGMKAMLDGARLWNAAVACNLSEAALCRGFDLVTVCLSKGLGAPVGSLVAGSAKDIHRCHRLRKMLGGGMRQSGILAAAGLYAIEHHRPRLGEDHEHATQLAERVAAIDGLSIATTTVDSNIVIVEVAERLGSAQALADRAREVGLLFWAAAARRIRLVTHRDVSRSDCERAATILDSLCKGS